MKKYIVIASLMLAACSNYKSPSLSGDPAKMSAETLCFRAAGSRNAELEAEIARRNLDCAGLLADDPLMSGPDESVHRM